VAPRLPASLADVLTNRAASTHQTRAEPAAQAITDLLVANG
jgi:hypothetical protein